MKEKLTRIKKLIKHISKLNAYFTHMSSMTPEALRVQYRVFPENHLKIEYAILYDIICDLETIQTEYIDIFTSHPLYKDKKNGLLR